MRLRELAQVLGGAALRGDPSLEVRQLAYDSRRVEPGGLFIAIRGFVHDGHDFIPEAVARGAVACLVERGGRVPPGVAEVRVPDTRQAAARAAAAFYGWPSRRLHVTGITGTNGKTTTAFLCHAVLSRRGPAGLVGTVENRIGAQLRPVERTTPEAVDLQALLRDMVDAGCRSAVMEVSSHSLSLHRVDATDFDVAVFTNLTQDHLDFHGTLERYLEAKARLFTMLGERGGAVVNADDPYGVRIAAASRAPVLWYGLGEGAQLRAVDPQVTAAGLSYTALWQGRRIPVRLALTGRFNIHNSLAALAAGLLAGLTLDEAAGALAGVPGVPGRLERIAADRPFAVIVDYAHTPDGLRKVLETARELAAGRVIAVFGCGGDRDRGKRPVMARLAVELADFSIFTSDNPRSEEPAAILQEMVAGARTVPGGAFRVEEDRAAAIESAIEMAREGDVVLIAGKGHETYQIFRDRTIHFDDREVARRILAGEAHPGRQP